MNYIHYFHQLFTFAELDAIPTGLNVSINLMNTKLVDHSVMENLENFKHDYESSGGNVSFTGLEGYTSMSSHPLSAKKKKVS